MSTWEPKLGDVVTFRSAPNHKMTVAGFNTEKKLYSVVWLNEQGAFSAVEVSHQTLAKAEDGPPSEEWAQRFAALEADYLRTGATLRELNESSLASRAEIAMLKGANVRAIMAARKHFDGVQADAMPDAIVVRLVEKLDTTIREANEQITRALDASTR